MEKSTFLFAKINQSLKDFKLLQLVLLLPVLGYSSSAWSNGYYLFEQSTNATGLVAAYIANASGADAALYNPANLVLDTNEKASLEVDAILIKTEPVVFSGTVAGFEASANSDSANIFLPNFFYSSPLMDNLRFGLSTSSTGLEQQWNETNFQTLMAKSTSIASTEINPVVSFKVNDKVSIGGGVRAVYTKGEVINEGSTQIMVAPDTYMPTTLYRKIDGDGMAYGFNLALTFKPIENLKLAMTYRSKTVTELEGDINMTSSLDGGSYNGSGNVEFILPAIYYLGMAYTIDRTTIEFVYNKLKWSDYNSLHIKADNTVNSAILDGAFNQAISKNWTDSETYRLGVTHQYNDKLQLVAGIAIDDTPVPDQTQSFELLDTNYVIFGLGAKYQLNQKFTLGGALLTAKGKKRHISNNDNGIEGSVERQTNIYNLSLTYNF